MTNSLLDKIVAAGGDVSKIKEALEKSGATGGTRMMTEEQRINWINGIESISEIRKAQKGAFAKKSSTGKDRYDREIEATKARLNELIAKANQFEGGVLEGLKFYNEDQDKILKVFIELKEEEIKAELKVLESQYTQQQIKQLINAFDVSTPDSLETEIAEKVGAGAVVLYNNRVKVDKETGDYRVRTLNQKSKLVAAIKDLPAEKEEALNEDRKEKRTRKNNDELVEVTI